MGIDWKMHWRLYGPFHCRPHADPGSDVPLLWNGAFNDSCVTHGSTMCPIPYFSPKVALDCINREKITVCNGVPTMFIAMLEHEDFKKTDFSHMRTELWPEARVL